jgi:hypothetical protein
VIDGELLGRWLAVAYYVIVRVAGRGGVRLVAVKLGKAERRVLRVRREATLLAKYVSMPLDSLIPDRCIDDGIAGNIGRFMGEWEFASLIAEYIRRCFGDGGEVSNKLAELESFTRRPVKVRGKVKRYPAVIYETYSTRNTLLAMFARSDAYCLDRGCLVRLHLFKNTFCIYSAYFRKAVFLPYDEQGIDPTATSNMSYDTARLLARSAELIEARGLEDGRARKAAETLRYAVAVWRMMEGG